jgi:anthranilate synthase component 2
MMRNILVLDNYDSFTYNLVQYIETGGVKAVVVRNDKITVEEALQYREIILSPGPGLPKDAGIMNELIRQADPTHKILGVCLGHQAIGEVFGGKLLNLAEVFHGVATPCVVSEPDPLFEGIPRTFNVGRYHSWALEHPIPGALEVIAVDEASGDIMAIRHRERNIRGVQFHPESILTDHGRQIMNNWLNIPLQK